AVHRTVVPRLFVGNSEAVQERVAERTLDLGFIEGDYHLASLVTDVCCEDELQVVCAPPHPLVRAGAVPAAALAEHAYVSREAGSGTREVISNYLQKYGLAPDALDVVMEASSPEALKGLVATGLGFAIMSRAAVSGEVRHGSLVCMPLDPPLLRNLLVVYPKERMQSKLVGAFLQFAKTEIAAERPVAVRNDAARVAISAR